MVLDRTAKIILSISIPLIGFIISYIIAFREASIADENDEYNYEKYTPFSLQITAIVWLSYIVIISIIEYLLLRKIEK